MVINALLLAIGAILHQITPALGLPMQPDFALAMLFIIMIINNNDYKITLISAIITGILVGTLFSQAITAIVLISAKQEVVFSIKLYADTVVITFIFFISMFCIIGLYNVIVLRKIKLIDMINAHNQVEFQLK